MTNSPILYETLPDGIARIVLNRPDTRNAQDTAFLYALNEAFDRAAHDDAVKVIVLSANGPHFSSGHDLREVDGHGNMARHETVGTWGGFGKPGAEAQYAREQEIYLGFCERWRNIPKPTLALVHGKVMIGGLMLMWPCDLIVCSDDAEFLDHSVAMGVGGAEFFAHPWEMGIRKAKEFLFTADWINAAEAHRLGMVNHVVPRAELKTFGLAMAERLHQLASAWLAAHSPRPSYRRYWQGAYAAAPIDEIGDAADTLVNYLSDSRSAKVIDALNRYPVVRSLWILRPFKSPGVSRALMWFAPLGIIFYLLALPYTRRVYREIRKVFDTDSRLADVLKED